MTSPVHQYIRCAISARLEGKEAFDSIYGNSIHFIAYMLPHMSESDSRQIVKREIDRAIKMVEKDGK